MYMKKRLLMLLLPLFLVACADKQQYEQVVLEEMKKEQDVKDYKIDPTYMAKCVIDTTYQRMPGLFAFDPDRLQAYRNYTKMLQMSSAKDPQKMLAELRKDFGSPQDLAKAHSVYTESVMDCYTAVLHESDTEEKT
jgi:negative regulator of sigma E activity